MFSGSAKRSLTILVCSAALTLGACAKKEEEAPKKEDAMMAQTALEGALDIVAWPAYIERGESDKARHVAARLKEFRNDQAEEFFAACGPDAAASGALPFQCRAPTRPLRFEDFR